MTKIEDRDEAISQHAVLMAPANCERVLTLDLQALMDLPYRDVWLALGRWLFDTPPRLARGLSAGDFQIRVTTSRKDGDAGEFHAKLVQLYIEDRLPANIRCRIRFDGKPGQLLVEIRRVS